MPKNYGRNIKIVKNEVNMSLTRDFKETIVARARRDSKFRQAMLIESINELLEGNVDSAKSMLRDYINATISFTLLAGEMTKNPKSLQRMFSEKGNPTTASLSEVLHILQKKEGIRLHVTSRKN